MKAINASLNDAIDRILFANRYQPNTTKEVEYSAEDMTKEQFSKLFLECISFEFTESESVVFTLPKTEKEINDDLRHILGTYRNSQISFLRNAYHRKEEYKEQLDYFLPLRGLSEILNQIKTQAL